MYYTTGLDKHLFLFVCLFICLVAGLDNTMYNKHGCLFAVPDGEVFLASQHAQKIYDIQTIALPQF